MLYVVDSAAILVEMQITLKKKTRVIKLTTIPQTSSKRHKCGFTVSHCHTVTLTDDRLSQASSVVSA
jgi:hypothetical protein